MTEYFDPPFFHVLCWYIDSLLSEKEASVYMTTGWVGARTKTNIIIFEKETQKYHLGDNCNIF